MPQRHRIKRIFNPFGVSNLLELISGGSVFRPPKAPRRLAAVTVLAILLTGLAACGGRDGRPPSGAEPVDVVVSATGGPLQASGALEPTTVSVSVRDDSGEVLRFDDEYQVDADGALERLPLSTDSRTLTLTLLADREYRFEAEAADASGSVLAYGIAEQLVTADDGQAVAIDLESLLGEAQLRTRLPIRSVVPGQEVDLFLNVTPRTRPDLVVPASDYQASYEPQNATVLEASEGGALVRAGRPESGDLVIHATASGSALSGDAVEASSVHATFRLPFVSDLTVDLEPPALSDLAFDADESVLRGLATDGAGVARLEIYDGPALLASTDLDAVADAGVAEVVFPDGGTAFQASIDLPAGSYSLTIFATDFSGNETYEDLRITTSGPHGVPDTEGA